MYSKNFNGNRNEAEAANQGEGWKDPGQWKGKKDGNTDECKPGSLKTLKTEGRR